MKFTFNFDEVQKQLESKINKLSPDLEKRMDKEIHKQALNIERQAKKLAPVDTGELRQKIATNQIAKGHYIIQSYANHAKFVEFGTSKQKAQPYFRPSYFKYKKELLENLKIILKGGKE